MKTASVKAAELRLKAAELAEFGSECIYRMASETFDVLLSMNSERAIFDDLESDFLQLYCLFAAEFVESES